MQNIWDFPSQVGDMSGHLRMQSLSLTDAIRYGYIDEVKRAAKEIRKVHEELGGICDALDDTIQHETKLIEDGTHPNQHTIKRGRFPPEMGGP